MNCTDYTNVFGRARWPDAPQRVLKTPFYVEWKDLPDHETEETQPIIGQSIIHGVVCIGCNFLLILHLEVATIFVRTFFIGIVKYFVL